LFHPLNAMQTTPNAVKQYMAAKNISSLLKWVATEIVVHRPEDPLAFLCNLSQRIVSRGDYAYSAESIEGLIESARAKSSDQVAEESMAWNRAATATEAALARSPGAGATRQDFSRMIESMRQIATELDPEKAARSIAEETCALLHCERAILFTFDAESGTVTANSERSMKDRTFPVNKGIVARCLRSGEVELIPDAAADADFDGDIDDVLGVGARNLLCCPLKDFESGEVCGIIQAINKKRFGSHDVDLLRALGTIGQITLQNGILYGMAAAEKMRNESMLNLWQHLNDESKVFNIHSLLFTITRRCVEIVDAEKCTFYFVDHQNKELWSIQGEVDIRMPIEKGMAGLCATSGDIVNEENVYKNQQFEQGTDRKTGFVTKSMLCVPMKATGDRVLGVIQLINKRGILEVFDRNDEQILALVLSAAAPIVERSQKCFGKGRPRTLSPAKDDKFVDDLRSNKLLTPKARAPRKIGDLIEEEPDHDQQEEEVEEDEEEEVE